jgi:hypothetical protein
MARARNTLGQFTARRSRSATTFGRRRFGGPVEGIETDGIVSGEAIILGGEEEQTTTRRTKSAAGS